jgi:2-succinyl-5-enolpyruvyl-6-hydroxy-3-cyclohexene-1-carboxylate synthase
LFPAVVEASLARVPLLLLTADRPLEVQAADAAQTIDQVKLFGDHARRFFDLGAPEGDAGALAGLRRLALQAVLATETPEPGPVHLNARAKKPLEPAAPATEDELRVHTIVNAFLERGVTRTAPPERTPAPRAVAELAAALGRAERALVVCGPLPPHAATARASLARLTERHALPLYAEATSGLRFGAHAPAGADALELLLRAPAARRALAPDVILRVGGVPTSAALDALLAEQPQLALHIVAEHGHPDALGRATTLTLGALDQLLAALGTALDTRVPSSAQRAFAASVASANARCNDILARALTDENGEAEMVRAAVASVPAHSVLVLGNSLPVRLVDAFVAAQARALTVVSQRGANGIDGLVAGAAGSAVAANQPTLLLLGDVSLAHDLGGLAAARLARVPFVVLVLDNEGGRIFDTLPVAKLYADRPERAEFWLTPPRVSFEHAAAAFGLPYAAPNSPAELAAVLARAFAENGPTLVHVRVSPGSAQATLKKIKTELERMGPSLFASAIPTERSQ